MAELADASDLQPDTFAGFAGSTPAGGTLAPTTKTIPVYAARHEATAGYTICMAKSKPNPKPGRPPETVKVHGDPLKAWDHFTKQPNPVGNLGTFDYGNCVD